jgi:hypothetical protein
VEKSIEMLSYQSGFFLARINKYRRLAREIGKAGISRAKSVVNCSVFVLK